MSGIMRFRYGVLVLLLLVSSLFAATFTDQYAPSPTGSIYAKATLNLNLDVQTVSANAYPGGSITLRITPSLSTSNVDASVECAAINAYPITTGATTAPVIFSQSLYNTYNQYLGENCGYVNNVLAGSSIIHCVDEYSGAGVCYKNANYGQPECVHAPPTTQEMKTVIYNLVYYYAGGTTSVVQRVGAGNVNMVCVGSLYVDGKYVGSLDSAHQVTLSIPSTATTTYTVPIKATYSCMMLTSETYTNPSLQAVTYLFAPASFSHSFGYEVELNSPEIEISSIVPSTISTCPGEQTSLVINVCNNGEVPVKVDSLTVSAGDITPATPNVDLNPAACANINAIYTAPDPVAPIVDVKVHAVQTTGSLQTSATSELHVAAPTLNVSVTSPSSINVDPAGKGSATLSFTNTGSVPATVNSLDATNGCTVAGFSAITLAPGESKTESVDIVCPTFPSTTTFNAGVNTSAHVCGSDVGTATSNIAHIIKVCTYLQGDIISTSPSTITISGGVGSFTAVVKNIGSVPFNVTNFTLGENFTASNFTCYPSATVSEGEQATCTVEVKVKPGATPPQKGVIPVAANISTECPTCNGQEATTSIHYVNYERTCGYLDFDAVGFDPTPVALGRSLSAPLNITIYNTGTLSLTITNLKANNGFNITSSTLPLNIPAGDFRTVVARVTYKNHVTQASDLPQSFNITITAKAVGTTCDGKDVAVQTYSVPVLRLGNLVPTITLNTTKLSGDQVAAVNVTVENNGVDVVGSSLLNVSVFYCTGPLTCHKLGWSSTHTGNYWIPGMKSGDKKTVRISPRDEGGDYDVKCVEGYNYILIKAVANNGTPATPEYPYDDDVAKKRIDCFPYHCKVVGTTDLYRLNVPYAYHVECLDSKDKEVPCSEVVGSSASVFTWSASTLHNYVHYNGPLPRGDYNVDASVILTQVVADDVMTINAQVMIPAYGTTMICTPLKVTIHHSKCEEEI